MNTSKHESNENQILPLTHAEAFAGIILATAASDGLISKNEWSYISFMLSRMHLFKSFTNTDYRTMRDKLVNLMNKQKITGFLETCMEYLPLEFHDTVFALAVDLILTDGICDAREQKFIKNLQQQLEIENKLVAEISKVTIIRNKLNIGLVIES